LLGVRLTRTRTRPFRQSGPEAAAYRRSLTVALPRVLNLYSLAPFFRGYLETLGIDALKILFSSVSDEEMFLEGARYGSVDACYPAKVAQSHIYQLLYGARYRNKPIDFVWFPSVTHLPNFVRPTVADTACPVVAGTPQVVKAAFTKERDLFAKRGTRYVDTALDFTDRALLETQLWRTWGEALRISEDENRFAIAQGFEALARHRRAMEAKGRAVLDAAEKEGRVVLLLLGRPYHADPGLNHDIPAEFQSLGYPVLNIASIPKDEAYLRRFFSKDIATGRIDNVFDIRDVWAENYATNSTQKVWAAKFAARHPNVAVVDISSFKCGHDAPTYDIIDKILSATRTPHLALHELDANKPGGSFKIRVKTFDYTLRQYAKKLQHTRKAQIQKA